MKINLSHCFNVFLIQSLYSFFLVCCVAFHMLMGGMRHNDYLTRDYIIEWVFLLLFFPVPLAYNILKWRNFKKKGLIAQGNSHLVAQLLFFVGLGAMYLFSL